MPKARRTATEYQAVCQGRDPAGVEWVHRSPQYEAAPHAREWADAHRFEAHEPGDLWVIDLVVYPVGGTPFAVDRWEPTGAGPPDPGRWRGNAPTSSPLSAEGRTVGRLLVARLREVLDAASAPSAGRAAGVTPADYADALRDGFDQFGDPGPPPGSHTPLLPPVAVEDHPDADRAPCGHAATAYGEKGEALCELEGCAPAEVAE